jgi:plastocyanin
MLLLIAVVLVIAGGYYYFNNLKPSHISKQNNSVKKPVLPKEVTVTLDKKGFSPSVVTIEVGSTVRWRNMSGDKQTVNSNDYPNNQLHRELNFGVFNNDSSVVYKFTKEGAYGYHNQFKPEQKGEIIVKK